MKQLLLIVVLGSGVANADTCVRFGNTFSCSNGSETTATGYVGGYGTTINRTSGNEDAVVVVPDRNDEPAQSQFQGGYKGYEGFKGFGE